MRNIVLYTAHSPLGGGGGVNLRSLISALPELDITWVYNHSSSVKGYENGYLGPGIMEGGVWRGGVAAFGLLSGGSSAWLEKTVNHLLALKCDAYWVVSHNEGMRIAFELATRQSARPVHLTVHDDWAGALCARSIRYRPLGFWARSLTAKTLGRVASFDVTSEAMKKYYHKKYGCEGGVSHRFVSGKVLPAEADISPRDPDGLLMAGHIGSVYGISDLLRFVEVFRAYAARIGRRPLLRLWGCHFDINAIPEALRPYITIHPNAPEADVVKEMRTCDFLYAMYPLTRRLRIFSETSMPTKLSTYVQVGRPVFGHGPQASTLTGFLEKTQLGRTWTNDNADDGMKVLETVIGQRITPGCLEQARSHYFGEANVATMRRVLNATGR